MANPEHLKVLNEGAEFWNSWRAENPYLEPDLEQAWIKGKNLKNFDLSQTNLHGAELSGAYLLETNLSRANLGEAELRGCILTRANLAAADLRLATLVRADLRGADLSHCRLEFARICEADVSESSFDGADLSWADLRLSVFIDASFSRSVFRHTNLGCACLKGANLEQVLFAGVSVEDTDFSEAVFQGGEFLSTDLSQAGSFDNTTHSAPTEIGLTTLVITAAGLVTNPLIQVPLEKFLRGCGLAERSIAHFRELVESPVDLCSVFITHSHHDAAFAQRLHDHLQEQGIRCWLDNVDRRRSLPTFPAVNRGGERSERTLLCCSESSLRSNWMTRELNKHFANSNIQRGSTYKPRDTLIPLDLDGYMREKNESGEYLWKDPHSGHIRDLANGDFKGWEEDNAEVSSSFEKLVDSLQSGHAYK